MDQLIKLDIPAELATACGNALAWSKANKITNHEQYQLTINHQNQTKSEIKQAEDAARPRIKQAHDLHKALCGDLSALIGEPVESVKVDDVEIKRWKKIVDDQLESERQRLQAIERERVRKERAKAEEAEAKQREIEAEARRKADEARQAAEKETNEKNRLKLLQEAAKAETKANTAAERADDKAAQAATIVETTISVQSAAPKVEGVTFRKTWIGRVVNEDAFWEFVFANKRRDLVEGPNLKVIDALAKAMKQEAKIPGVVFEEVTSTAKSR